MDSYMYVYMGVFVCIHRCICMYSYVYLCHSLLINISQGTLTKYNIYISYAYIFNSIIHAFITFP